MTSAVEGNKLDFSDCFEASSTKEKPKTSMQPKYKGVRSFRNSKPRIQKETNVKKILKVLFAQFSYFFFSKHQERKKRLCGARVGETKFFIPCLPIELGEWGRRLDMLG